jgi:hypothetical protein
VTAGQILDNAARKNWASWQATRLTWLAKEPGLPVVIGGGFVAAVPELVDTVEGLVRRELRAGTVDNARLVGLSTAARRSGCTAYPAPFATWAEEVR